MTNETSLPPVDFDYEIDQDNPLRVKFTAPNRLPDAAKWEWDFGDPDSTGRYRQGKNTASGRVVVHTFTDRGTYCVALQIKDEAGKLIKTISKNIEVTSPSSVRYWWQAIGILLILVGLPIIGLTGLGFVVEHIWDTAKMPEILLPIQIIGSVLLLLVVLVLTATVFHALNISDRNLAFALPQGSIRSVIALSLILVYVVSAFFLYGELEPVYTMSDIQEDQLSEMTELLGQEGTIVSIQPVYNSQDENAAPEISSYEIKVKTEVNQERVDFGKDIITTISTLVIAIVGFYFGSRTSASNHESNKELETITVSG